MRYSLLICFVLLVSANIPFAQPLTTYWDETYELGGDAQLNKLIQSVNGWLVGVGSKKSGNNIDGLFFIIDEETGDIIDRKEYKGKGEEVINDIVQLPDGGFYLAGYTTTKSNGKRDALLLRVDERGNVISKLQHGGREDEYFSFINLFPDGRLLLTGLKDSRGHKGEVWLASVEKMKVRSDALIGEGMLKDVIGTHTTQESTVMLFGNTTGKGGSEAGKAWRIEVDQNGVVIRQMAKVSRNDQDELYSLNVSPFGDVLLSGASRKGQQINAWVVEMNEQGSELLNMAHEKRDDEFGQGAVRTVRDEYLIARKSYSSVMGGGYSNKLTLLQNSGETSEYEIPGDDNFNIRSLYYTYWQRFIVAGTTESRGSTKIRVLSLEEDTRLGSIKSSIKLSCSTPRLRDPNRNDILEQDERGYIEFEISNEGDVNVNHGMVRLEGNKASTDFDKTFFGFLKSGSKKTIRVPIHGKILGTQSTLELKIVVLDRNERITHFPFKIKSRPAADGSGYKTEIVTQWKVKDGEFVYRGNKRENIRESDGRAKIEYEVFGTQQMKGTDIRLIKNNNVLEDQKSPLIQDADHYIVDAHLPHRHYFLLDIPLDKGENEIIVEIYHEGRVAHKDTINFKFLPEQPNLHVMIVTPETSLDYNQLDGRGFAKIMQAQEGRGYFNEVFIDTLVTKEETQADKIKFAFLKLSKRHMDGSEGEKRITSNDVLVVFISSHGFIGTDGNFKIQPSNYDSEYGDFFTVDYQNDILSELNKINCKKIVFIDACHSGAAGEKGEVGDISKVLNDLNARAPGHLTITSSKKGEKSYEYGTWENGAFTEAIIEAFQQKPVLLDSGLSVEREIDFTEDGQALISIENLFLFLQQRIPDLIRSTKNPDWKQTPHIPQPNKSLMQVKFLLQQ